MKKFVLAVLIVVVLLSSASSEVRAENESESRLMHDLIQYIRCCEVIYSDILWVTDAFDRFDRERSWESLQLARAAVMLARIDLEIERLPALKLTTEDRKNFMKRGIDIYQGDMRLMFERDQNVLMTTWEYLNMSIIDVFSKEGWQIAMRVSANDRKLMNLLLKDLADTADEVLAELNDPAFTKSFNELMQKHCPKTHALQRKELESPEKIKASRLATLKQIEDVVKELTKIVGTAKNSLNASMYATKTGNFASYSKKDMMAISDMPLMIPQPSWFNYHDITYSWKKDGKFQPLPMPRTKLEIAPNGCHIKIYGVPLFQVKAYQNQLKNTGLTYVGGKEEAKQFLLFYVLGDSELAISWDRSTLPIPWDNGNVEIFITGKSFCFVPISYFLSANTKK